MQTLNKRKLECLLPSAKEERVLVLDSKDKLNTKSLYDIVILKDGKNFEEIDLRTLLLKAGNLTLPGGYLQIDTENRCGISFATYQRLFKESGFDKLALFGCLPSKEEPRYILSLDSPAPFIFYVNIESENSRKLKLLKFWLKIKINISYLTRQFYPGLTILARKEKLNG